MLAAKRQRRILKGNRMAFRFTVLASGSAGNASLLEAGGFGLLLDAGLGPRQLAARLAAGGRTWNHVHAVLLTHTHGDHWNERTLAHLRRRRLPLYCYPAHHPALSNYGWEFARLQAENLVRPYEPDGEWDLAPGLRCRALQLRHDGGATFGFRFWGPAWSVGYAADLGSWAPELATALADVDLLALEFNHDVELEYASGRSPQLIARVLGDEGHLSNEQAAALLHEVLRRSAPGRLRHLVQLHLSRECNHPTLAVQAARAMLTGAAAGVQVHTAAQDRPSPSLTLAPQPEVANVLPPPRRAAAARKPRPASSCQPWLPGWEA
jgi:phosphoribosyl 1,2-cyclic phosphodiesterase